MARSNHTVTDRPRKFRLVFTGLVLGCLLFFLTSSGILLTAEIIKTLPSPPIKKFQRIIRLNPFDDNSWFALGRAYYYSGDCEKAKVCFGKALSANRLSYPALIELMWLSLKDVDDKNDVVTLVQTIDLLAPADIGIHWKILIRTMTFDAPWARRIALGEIRLLLPLYGRRRTQLFRIAGLLLKNDGRLLTFVPDDRAVKISLLHYLLYRKKRVDLAGTLWDEINTKGWEDKALFRTMINGFFYNKRYEKAWELWRKKFSSAYEDTLVFNGGFEKDFLNYGFSWRRQGKRKGVKRVRFVHFFKSEGRRSFSIEFDGEHNPAITNPYQYIYLEPGDYRLRASLALKDITSASGFYLEFSGHHIRSVSDQFKGDRDWENVELLLHLKVPGIYRVSLRRNATRKLNRFLGGKVFLDDVSLVKLND